MPSLFNNQLKIWFWTEVSTEHTCTGLFRYDHPTACYLIDVAFITLQEIDNIHHTEITTQWLNGDTTLHTTVTNRGSLRESYNEPSCDGDHHWFSFWFFLNTQHYLCICACICMSIRMYIYILAHIYINVYVWVCVYIHIYIYMCMCVCIYI